MGRNNWWDQYKSGGKTTLYNIGGGAVWPGASVSLTTSTSSVSSGWKGSLQGSNAFGIAGSIDYSPSGVFSGEAGYSVGSSKGAFTIYYISEPIGK